MCKFSFVIPCYRSEATLEFVVNEIIHVMSKLNEFDFEIVLVNDNSEDNTRMVIKRLCSERKNIKGIELARNFGQHSAIMAGFMYVDGEIIIAIDDDGQLPIDELPKFINMIYKGYDVVIGDYHESKQNKFRKLGTMINDFMAHTLINKPKDIHFTSFIAVRRFIVDEILKYKNPYPYLPGLILRVSDRIANVSVAHRERVHGKSGYTFKKLMSLWLNGFTAFSVKPLRIATVIGIICSFIGFIFGAYTIINKLLNPNVLAGYSSLMAVVLFISGVNMFMIGLIGEYIGRIYISINNSPQYVVRETINFSQDQQITND